MRIQRCKGSRDLPPAEMRRFRLIEDIFRDHCLKWGYEEVRTPTIEYLHLFTSTGTLTPSLLNRVYSFLDWDGWSGERVVLRPDGTIPVARFYTEEMAAQELAKLFYVANVFVFEETGTETRERWQCGAELIGVDSPLANVELVALTRDILTQLGLKDIQLRLSHAGLIRVLLSKLELSPEEQTRILDQVLDGDIGVLLHMRTRRGRSSLKKILPALLDLQGKSAGFLKNFKGMFQQDVPELVPPLDDFIAIVDLLEVLDGEYQIDITSGKGFEYYTGVMFKMLVDGVEVGGGGRYNALIPLLGGGDIPASGFALYMDHLMNLIPPPLGQPPLAVKVLVIPASTTPQVTREAYSIAQRLRDAGYCVEFNLGSAAPSDGQWQLEVSAAPSKLVLTDSARRRWFEVTTTDEVLQLLREHGVD